MPQAWSFEQALAGLAAIAGGLGTGAVIGLALLRFIFRDWTSWRQRVEAKLDRLQPEHIMKIDGFDPQRLDAHYRKVHDLTAAAAECKMGFDRHGKQLDDHEQRIRVVEARRP